MRASLNRSIQSWSFDHWFECCL